MKKRVLSWLILLSAVFVSTGVFAKCDQERNQQKIIIKKINGKIEVENKTQSTRCRIKNNNSNDESNGSHVVWVFQDLNCQPGECEVELDGQPCLSFKVLNCDLGNPNNSRCRLKVNKLKQYCDKQNPSNPTECEFNYLIKVRGEIIDPTIIIRPRPIS